MELPIKLVHNFSHAYQTNHQSYGLEIFPHTIILSEVYQMEEILNQIKIERMVSNYFSSYNLEQLKI